mgnify:CR=1 FL=1
MQKYSNGDVPVRGRTGRAGRALRMTAALLVTGAALVPGAVAAAEWETIEPGGETACAVGEYRFYARQDAPDRVFIHLDGGGACWDAETCALDSGVYYTEVGPSPAQRDGVFDLGHPDNPVASHSMLVIPYCTGDVHLGNRDTTYTLEKEDGTRETVTVPHRGLANAEAALEWLYERFDAPEQIVVTGSSAGAVATAFYADQLARRYPDARVIGLADAASAYRRNDASAASDDGAEPFESWGLPVVLQAYPGWEDYGGGGASIGFETLFIRAATAAPNLELYTFDQAYDAAQQSYIRLLGTEEFDLLERIRANHADIARASDSFRYFVVGGIEHTVLGMPRFYFYEADGVAFHDWMADLVAGEPVDSVVCEQCSRPALRYTRADLDLIDGALALLSSEQRWAANDDARCEESATTWSLYCAVVESARRLGEQPRAFAAFSDVIHSALDHLDYDRIPQRLLTHFNNAEQTGFDDVRSVLLDVRERVSAGLGEDASQPAAE